MKRVVVGERYLNMTQCANISKESVRPPALLTAATNSCPETLPIPASMMGYMDNTDHDNNDQSNHASLRTCVAQSKSVVEDRYDFMYLHADHLTDVVTPLVQIMTH